ncbi:MAG: hypothetical protein A2283_11525 [Lentisphaerae bacterium RIFOXYA12_FULL_48_11]|nr:MAG: hypothetical protein A2283_11525 [Lentisphaerae bacterium RIFOXYA12_FULL_48_11]
MTYTYPETTELHYLIRFYLFQGKEGSDAESELYAPDKRGMGDAQEIALFLPCRYSSQTTWQNNNLYWEK